MLDAVQLKNCEKLERQEQKERFKFPFLSVAVEHGTRTACFHAQHTPASCKEHCALSAVYDVRASKLQGKSRGVAQKSAWPSDWYISG
jgi:Fe-S-cluster-containing hydrogenase component 2